MYPHATRTIHLADIGAVPAVFLHQVAVGDELMWDHGTRSLVIGIEPLGRQLVVTLAGVLGADFTRARPRTVLVAAIRAGRWLADLSPVDPVARPCPGGERLVCRVTVWRAGARPRYCGALVDAWGRCDAAHYPGPNRTECESDRLTSPS